MVGDGALGSRPPDAVPRADGGLAAWASPARAGLRALAAGPVRLLQRARDRARPADAPSDLASRLGPHVRPDPAPLLAGALLAQAGVHRIRPVHAPPARGARAVARPRRRCGGLLRRRARGRPGSPLLARRRAARDFR